MSRAQGWVAIVDDDPAFTELAVDILDGEGIRARAVPIGGETLEVLRRERPAVLVVDWRLAGAVAATSESMIGEIAADPTLAAMPIILCSGDMLALRDATPRLVAMADVVAVEKPFEIDTFVGAVERALHRAGIVDEVGIGTTTRPRPAATTVELLAGSDLRAQTLRLLGGVRALGWDAVDLWLLDRGVLRCVGADADARRSTFAEASQSMPVLNGVGIVGRVAVSGRPVWVEDLERDKNFPRWQLAQRAGLRSAAAVPCLLDPPPIDGPAGGEARAPAVAAVIGVYSADHRPRDEAMLTDLWSIAEGAAAWAAIHHDALLQPPGEQAEIAELVDRALADADLVVVDAVDSDGGLYRLATAHRDPSRQHLARRLATHEAVGSGPAGEVMRTGTLQRASPSEALLRRWARGPEHLTLLRALELRDVLSLPILDGAGRMVGVLSATSATAGAFDDPSAVRRLETIARAIGARRMHARTA